MLSRIAVVVPAHDERELLPACLAALRRSAGRIAPIPVEIIVVADACTDDTAETARAAGAHVEVIGARNVGRARRAGMAHALRDGTEGLWLATTDADSRVGPGWFAWHRRHAAAGAEVLAGTVTVGDWSPWPATVRAEYDVLYRAGITATGHSHVHGANLGCAASTYQRIGGFAGRRHDEDRDLIARAEAAGARVVHDTGSPVVTSGRRTARAPAGFAALLTSLALDARV